MSLSVILPPVVCPSRSPSSAAPSRYPGEGPADPGTLVLRRLKPALIQERKGILVPAAVRKIVAEHGRRSLRLARHTKRQIGLGQPQQRLLNVPRGLIPGDDLLEVVDRAGVVAPLHVVAPNQHPLTGQL